jgi:hypothetical protein
MKGSERETKCPKVLVNHYKDERNIWLFFLKSKELKILKFLWPISHLNFVSSKFCFFCLFSFRTLYIYVYMYIHICIYIYIYVYTYMYMYIYICIYIYIYVYIYMYIHIYIICNYILTCVYLVFILFSLLNWKHCEGRDHVYFIHMWIFVHLSSASRWTMFVHGRHSIKVI